MRRPSLFILFLTVFIDLVGFGLVIPLLPVYSRAFGGSGLEVGLIFAAYSAMQFVFPPWWGGLSDRVGRRPVLLVSTAGAAASYAVFAIASGMTDRSGLWIFLGSRMLAGICGANITVAQAYIADITPPSERSKRMGLIGMALSMVYPTLKPMLEASIRKVTVAVKWREGAKDRDLSAVQYVTDPREGSLNPNAADILELLPPELGGTGTPDGTGSPESGTSAPEGSRKSTGSTKEGKP